MKVNQLTARFVATVKPQAKVRRYVDGVGLMLVVQPSGGKSWIQRIQAGGRRRDIGLGPLALVGLAEAREKALDNWRRARTGGALVGTSGAPTFAAALDAVIRVRRPTWKRPGIEEQTWRQSLATYAGAFSERPVDAITTADVLAVLAPIWHTKRPTAKAVKVRLSVVFQWAIAQGHRRDDPAGDEIKAALPKGGSQTRHHRAAAYAALPPAVRTLRERGGIAALALEFLILTAGRSTEIRGARWSEVDLEAARWTIPASRMKAKKEHRVPLSPRAVQILREARALAGGTELVFPRRGGSGPIADRTLGALVRTVGLDSTVHGMRSTFRDWCGEFGVARELAEAALAHTVKGVEGAYARSDLLDRRRVVMDRWAAYLSGDGEAAKVVTLAA